MAATRLDVGVRLPLVVRRAAGHQLVALDRRLERRVAPQLDRVDRLHVVVPIEEDRRLARRAQPLGVDQRMAGRVDPLRLEARLAQLAHQELARPQDLGLVVRVRRDRGDADVVLQLLEIPLLLGVDAREHVPRIASHPVQLSFSLRGLARRESTRVPLPAGEAPEVDGVDQEVAHHRPQKVAAPRHRAAEERAGERRRTASTAGTPCPVRCAAGRTGRWPPPSPASPGRRRGRTAPRRSPRAAARASASERVIGPSASASRASSSRARGKIRSAPHQSPSSSSPAPSPEPEVEPPPARDRGTARGGSLPRWTPIQITPARARNRYRPQAKR